MNYLDDYDEYFRIGSGTNKGFYTKYEETILADNGLSRIASNIYLRFLGAGRHFGRGSFGTSIGNKATITKYPDFEVFTKHPDFDVFTKNGSGQCGYTYFDDFKIQD